MRALHFVDVGRLAWRDAPDPRLSDDRQAVVRPVASTTCDLDRRIARGLVDVGKDFPIGHECVAEVVTIGDDVRGVVPGDLVVVPWHISCGVCPECRAGVPAACSSVPRLSGYGVPVAGEWGGLFSDLVLVPFADGMLTPLPAGMEPAVAAPVSDNLTDAYAGVRRGLSQHPGAATLIVATLPSLGLFAVDQAFSAGAGDVVYVDPDAGRRRVAESFGASTAPAIDPATHHDRFPVVVGVAREDELLAEGMRCLAPGGHFSNLAIFFKDTPLPLWDMYQRGMTFTMGFISVTPHAPAVLAQIAASSIHPERVITVRDWDDAPDAILSDDLKPVMTRPPLGSR